MTEVFCKCYSSLFVICYYLVQVRLKSKESSIHCASLEFQLKELKIGRVKSSRFFFFFFLQDKNSTLT